MDELVAMSSPLRRDRSFALFWTARAVSIAGSTVTAAVLPLLVFQLTGSALLTEKGFSPPQAAGSRPVR